MQGYINTQFADTLLRYIVDNNGKNIIDREIAIALKEDLQKIKDHLIYINEHYPSLLVLERSGYGTIRPVLTRDRLNGISYFLEHGGTVGLEKPNPISELVQETTTTGNFVSRNRKELTIGFILAIVGSLISILLHHYNLV